MSRRTPPRVRVELAGAAAGVRLPLDERGARHLTRSLRLGEGDAVLAFDGDGRTAAATLSRDGDAWFATLAGDVDVQAGPPPLTVCCATPKGARADWLAEKLGELAATRLVPLVCERGVVEPGANKVERWRRLASEAARQSGAASALDVAEPASTATALADIGPGVVLTTERPAGALASTASVVYVGPEGGWSPAELAAFDAAGCSFASLGGGVLRVETAALVAAALVRCGGE